MIPEYRSIEWNANGPLTGKVCNRRADHMISREPMARERERERERRHAKKATSTVISAGLWSTATGDLLGDYAAGHHATLQWPALVALRQLDRLPRDSPIHEIELLSYSSALASHRFRVSRRETLNTNPLSLYLSLSIFAIDISTDKERLG